MENDVSSIQNIERSWVYCEYYSVFLRVETEIYIPISGSIHK